MSNKSFWLLLIGQFISVVGDRISTAVFVSIAVVLAGSLESSYQSNLLVAIQILPLFLFGYFCGFLADVAKKKKLMIISDIIRGGAILLLFFFHDSLAVLYICVFLVGVGYAVFEPSRKAILPFLIKKEKLVFYNKLYGTMEIGAMIIGLGVGAFLLKVISIEAALLLDFATYFASIILLAFIRYKDSCEDLTLVEEERIIMKKFKNFLKEVKQGYIFVKGNVDVRTVFVALIFVHYLASTLFFTAATDFAIKTAESQVGAGSDVSYVLFLAAVGALFAPLLLWFFKKLSDSAITLILFLFGTFNLLCIALFSTLFYNQVLLAIFLFLIGLVAGSQYIRYLYLVHLTTPKKIMGRVMAIAELILAGTVVSGILLGTLFNEIFTYKYGFLLSSLVYLCGFFWFLYVRKKLSW